jgi:peptide/nickel transport system ATP-binding protein
MAVHAELADRVAVMYAGDVVEVGDVRQIFKAPRHPYTQGLISSIPTVGGERERLGGIAGNAPTPLRWPTGCRFHPRCPHVMPICVAEYPELLRVKGGEAGTSNGKTAHAEDPLVACHLYGHQAATAVGSASQSGTLP